MNIGISYCRLLLHDTMLKYDSYKTGSSSSPICDCGSGESETTEHFLLRCSNYTAARKVMFEKIEALGLFSHDQFHTNVNEHLLLAPSDNNNNNNNNNHDNVYGAVIVLTALREFTRFTR